MAGPHGQIPWNNSEKNYLLAEIIKQSSPPPNVLLDVVNRLGIQQPIWEDLPLPPGRSLSSCRPAFEDMRRRQPPAMIPTGIPPLTPSPASAPLALKRPFPFESSSSFSTGREIRPKPSNIAGGYIQQSPVEQQPKKKRGRPTKAEAQARAEAQAGTVEVGPAPRPLPSETINTVPAATPAIQVPLIEQAPPEEVRPLPPVSRMPISSILTLTPTGPQSTSQSSSSSGKRRRAKSTRSELEDVPSTEALGGQQSQEYESPYARMVLDAQDSPARTAVMRHRDEYDSRPPYSGTHPPEAREAPPTSTPDLGTT